MLWLHGLPMIGWLHHRLQKSRELDSLVFAIAGTDFDQALATYLQGRRTQIYKGSENDVLARIYLAGKEAQATHVVRVCADNPFTDPQEIDHLVRFYFSNNYDYAYNHIPKNNCYPDGLGAEMVSIVTLAYIHEHARSLAQREHAFNYIWDNQSKFKIATFEPKEASLQHPDLKLDVDSYEQYLRLLRMNIHPDMSAKEIIDCFLAYERESCISSS